MTVRRLLTSPTLLFLLSTDLSFSLGDGVGLFEDHGDGPFDTFVDDVFRTCGSDLAVAADCCSVRFIQQNSIHSMYTSQKLARVMPEARFSKSASKL